VVVDSSKKNVAIRGLDIDLYNDVFARAKREGKRVSDLVNIALKTFMNGEKNGDDGDKINGDDESSGRFVLRNNGEITLSKSDIISLRKEVGPFQIENNGRLVFEKDVDVETVKYIENIVIHDGSVEVPRTLYPQFLMRSEIHGKLEKY
jgi:hypothetical protein